MARYKDISNKRFGRLTAISFAGVQLCGKRGGKKALWLCKCDCGNEITTAGHNLVQEFTKSCGCLQKEVNTKHIKSVAHKAWKKKTLPFGDSIRREVITGYKGAASARNLDWELTDEKAAILMESDCHYCGIKPSTIRSRIRVQRTNLFTYNGIDRVDNEKGYLESNVVTCCEWCNYSKRSLSYKEFQDYISRLVEFRSKSGVVLDINVFN